MRPLPFDVELCDRDPLLPFPAGAKKRHGERTGNLFINFLRPLFPIYGANFIILVSARGTRLPIFGFIRRRLFFPSSSTRVRLGTNPFARRDFIGVESSRKIVRDFVPFVRVSPRERVLPVIRRRKRVHGVGRRVYLQRGQTRSARKRILQRRSSSFRSLRRLPETVYRSVIIWILESPNCRCRQLRAFREAHDSFMNPEFRRFRERKTSLRDRTRTFVERGGAKSRGFASDPLSGFRTRAAFSARRRFCSAAVEIGAVEKLLIEI